MLLAFPETFTTIAIPVFVVICAALGVSNISLMRHEGVCLHNALSLFFGILFIGVTVVLYGLYDAIYNGLILPNGLERDPVFMAVNAAVPTFFLLMLCYLECVFAGVCILAAAASRVIPKYDKDFVIILGCSIDKKGGLRPLLKQRTDRAIRFAWDQEIASGKPVLFVPSGGKGTNEVISEASAMEIYLLTHGAEKYEVFPEKESRNTYENMVFSKRIIDRIKPGAKVSFATTNYHIFRSGIYAIKAGLDAEGIASGTKWYFWPNGFIREFFAILRDNKRTHFLFTAILFVLCAGIFIFMLNYSL